MDVKVSIKTSQILNEEQVDTIEEKYEGQWIEKSGHIYIKFENGNMSKATSGLIKIGDDKIIVHRKGEINSKMMFIENESYRTTYDAGYAIFDMLVHTYKIEKKIEEKSIEIKLQYSLSLDRLMESQNRVEINVMAEE